MNEYPLQSNKRVCRGAGLLLVFSRSRPHQLGRLDAARRFEGEAFFAFGRLVYADGDGVLAAEIAVEQLLGERVFEIVLDGAAERAGAVFGVGSFLDQKLLGLVG